MSFARNLRALERAWSAENLLWPPDPSANEDQCTKFRTDKWGSPSPHLTLAPNNGLRQLALSLNGFFAC